MRNIRLILIVLLCLSGNLMAQTAPEASDCPQAIPLTIGEVYRYAESPAGPGQLMEIKGERHDPHFFEEEHHTVWYKFRAPSAGLLTMEIVPFRTADDYDFLIFKAEDGSICESVLNQELTPVLTNISRTSKAEKGRTGLRPNSGRQFVAEGPGEAFSRPLGVKPGEVYYIVVDNVYDGGKGHTIQLNLEQMVHVSGKVVSDVDGTPLEADIIYEEKATGKVLVKAKSDQETGEFDLDLPLKDDIDYSLVISADSHFFKMQTFNSKRIKNLDLTFRVTMPKLEIDRTFPLPDINFQPGTAVVLRSSYPTLRALKQFMKKNPTIDISLEGHVNGMNHGIRIPSDPLFEQELSDDRARAVFNYLVNNKIPRKRVTSRGFGTLYMLYPNAMTEKEMMLNRRVEVRMGGWTTPGKGIEFAQGSWEEVLQQAQKSNKFIMVDAYTSWCRPCAYMTKHVFADANVASFFSPRFLTWKVDMETPTGSSFAKSFPVDAYPTLLFFNPQGELVSQVVGARNQPELIKLGKAVLDLDKLKGRYTAGERDIVFLFSYMDALAATGNNPEQLVEEFKAATPKGVWHTVKYFNFFADEVTTYEHPYFKVLFDGREGFSKSLNPQKVNEVLLNILAGESAYQAGVNKDKEAMKVIEGYISELTSNPDCKGISRARLNFAVAASEFPAFKASAEQVLRQSEADWKLYYSMGMKAGRFKTEDAFVQALQWVRKSISLDRNATNTLGEVRLLAVLGEHDKALEQLEVARRLGLIEGKSSNMYDQLKEKIHEAEGAGVEW